MHRGSAGQAGSKPAAISADGQTVVGVAETRDIHGQVLGSVAWKWTAADGILPLGQDAAGLPFSRATGVTPDGNTMIGYGINPYGQTEAWIARVPEPATLGLMVAGTVVLVRVRRRAQRRRVSENPLDSGASVYQNYGGVGRTPPGLREGSNPPSQTSPNNNLLFCLSEQAPGACERKVAMPRSLPNSPSLRYLKEEAKDLLKAHGRRDAACCPTLRHLHRFARCSDQEILAAGIGLQEVQFALAMDYGFASWDHLAREVLRPLLDEVSGWMTGTGNGAGQWAQVLGQITPQKRWLAACLCKNIKAQHAGQALEAGMPETAIK